ncbi:putative Transcription initiation factor TFIID subunit 13 [Hypsibius exemplaris]|uniref:Transcription initiation factor TFIID subunit 13 n=1 Tax=Hypsibius exemplaris TaxID=2072580 RepID=A0A1W0WDN8_HYPEX|nr:putative Transcription initiation factor TFIID subunit 13 [Hypsibius exemplaris]
MTDETANDGVSGGVDDQQDETASISSTGTSTSTSKHEKKVSGSHGASSSKTDKRIFQRELRCMMYGFGDDQNPYTESVELLEDLVVQYMIDMTSKALEIGKHNRVQVEDLIYLVRHEPRKFARVHDLLSMNEELKRARKAFDEAKY